MNDNPKINNYIIYPNGKIYSKKRNKFLKWNITKSGYAIVKLGDKWYQVHRLIAMKYLENKNNYSCINHKDKNTLNNNVENLEWCTIKYNVRYSKAKKVYCYDKSYKLRDIKSCTKDFKELGYKHVSECAQGKIHTCGGLVFSYIPLTEDEVCDRYFQSPAIPLCYEESLKMLKK